MSESKTYESLIQKITSNTVKYTDQELSDKRIVFVIHLDEIGYDLNILGWLKTLPEKSFRGSVGSLIVTSPTPYHTKSFAQDVILLANKLGMTFIGHSVLEIVKDYENFKTWQKTIDLSLETIAMNQGKDLLERLRAFETGKLNNLIALHASSRKTSNTLTLWHMVRKYVTGLDIREIHIENGTVVDCIGCQFQTCIHYGKNHSCFYGGIMVEEVLPAIETSDALVWVCPNYNDAISANMMAVINRLTVLYRQMSFHDKACYAVIVSGNSGSDTVAKQLIGALNINKGFQLPPNFVIMATANDPLKVLEIEGIEKKAQRMAENINIFCQNVK
ncbi:NAD(P)H-dependent oxidoreductase [Acidaminobacter sp. JC074]|nr:NAD(P)H-dependent oxidoreductase [Acidaminobacter sp. JC074]